KNDDDYNANGHSCHDDVEEEEEEGLSRRSKGKKKQQSFSLLRSSGYVDPGWEHGVAQDERKKKVKCSYCGKVVSGGINRFKQHLARIPGEVAPCKAAPEEVYVKIKENMKWHRAGKRQNVPDDVRALTVSHDPEQEEEEEEEEEDGFYGRFSKDKRRSNTRFVSEARPKRARMNSFQYTGCSSRAAVSRREVTSSISKFFHHVGVPLEAANSLYFQKMVELIGLYGEGYVVPSSQLFSDRLLHDQMSTIKGHLRDYRSSWIVTGCSILADTWTNAEGKTMIGFLVSCPRGNEFTQGMDLLKPETTRHASSFATLQTLMDHKANLRALFQSNSWILSQKSEEGREVEKIVSSAAFWKKVQYVLKSVDPVMQVIRMGGGDGGERLYLPYAYGYMCCAKMGIKSIHSDDARKYGPFWRVIDYHWNSLFHHPLYVAAYFFNPAYRYRSDFMAHSEVVRGVNECIVRLEPDNARRITALMQIPDYTSAKGDFGTELAIGTRTELDPAAWWQQHGISCLELQRVAVRILSHTCCSVGCEPKWSVYDQVSGECQSRFARKSRRDLAYVHYNLRLREKQMKRRMHDEGPPQSLNPVLLDRLLPDWLVTCEKEEEEGLEDEDGAEKDDQEEEEEEENCYDDSANNVYGDGEDNVDVYNDDLSDDD
ncbi:hypothetical protein HID58_003149, partial [Brassica napus]